MKTGNDDLKTVARGGSIATVGAILAAAGGLLLTVLVGRGLGPTGAGLFFEAVGVFTIASSVCMFGADTTLLRDLSRARVLGRLRDIRRILIVALVPVAVGTTVITAVLVHWAPQLVHLVVHTNSPHQAVRYFSLLLPFLAIGTVSVVIAQATRAFGGVGNFVLVQNILLPLGRPLLILLIILAGWSQLYIPLAWGGLFVPALAISCWTLLRQVRRTGRRIDPQTPPARRFSEIAVSFWRFASVRGIAAAIDLSLVWFDVLFVGAIRTTAEAGIYGTASRFVTSGTLVMQAMRLAIAPQISILMSTGQKERAGEVYRVATLWIVLTSWPLYLILALFGPLVLEFFGHSFKQAGAALTILALSMLVNLGTGNVGTILLMAGKSQWLLINKSAAVTANVGLNLWLVPHHGIDGAAIAWGVAIAIDNLLSVAEVRWGLGLNGYGAVTSFVAGAALVCFGGIGLLAIQIGGLRYSVFAIYLEVSTLAYLAILRLMKDRLHLEELVSAFGRGARSRSARARHIRGTGAKHVRGK